MFFQTSSFLQPYFVDDNIQTWNDLQMRTYAIAAPETEELVRRVQNFVDQADAQRIITDSKPLIDEIQKQSERISRLPTPAGRQLHCDGP